MSGYNVAVVGATGNVGRAMLDVLMDREFPVNEIHAVASKNSEGKEISFGDKKTLKVKDLEKFDFSGVDIALFSPGASVSKIHAPRAASQGCVVIDNTSHFRMLDGYPLVVPEVNPHALKDFRSTNIIANPNCSTIQMVVALAPLHKAFGIKRVVVATYQSVSGAGKEGMDELYNQTKSAFLMDDMEPKKFTKRIAFNVIPHIDVFMDDGYTKEEWKMMVETKKIMGDDIAVTATCVRVPVFVGHSEAVNVEFERPVTVEAAYDVLEEAEGLTILDRRENGGYATPVDCVGEDGTYISRLRKDPTVANGLSFWVVADNVRKGAATNAVQIVETLVSNYGL
jgi:aspartate-semialdehyde dehydrogenase